MCCLVELEIEILEVEVEVEEVVAITCNKIGFLLVIYTVQLLLLEFFEKHYLLSLTLRISWQTNLVDEANRHSRKTVFISKYTQSTL